MPTNRGDSCFQPRGMYGQNPQRPRTVGDGGADQGRGDEQLEDPDTILKVEIDEALEGAAKRRKAKQPRSFKKERSVVTH